ncbi:DUF2987 domain-containing protein [Grimontia marina]|uniref:DUF2987 domain-containing protein n=1 Tax=Grimontia marina TaxID=646534 RepID=A0A128EZ89_9GAMM|nr:DUF2987 domain-containing protein [Grimontia marina]CZF79361.1 hypothetical protein GMA8713_00939 [Grimontia marina]
MIRGLTAVLLAAVISSPVAAAQVKFSYSKLYTQLKHNYGENHPDVKIGYFMISPSNGDTCKITKAWMTKKAHYEEFEIPASQELPLPIDSHLRKVNPDVFIETAGTQACDISFQVMAKKSFGSEVTEEQVNNLVPQMTTMMKDLGGMFSSWFMPEVEGVTVHFANVQPELKTSEGRAINVEGKVAIIRLNEMKTGERVFFPQKPLKVTPWIPQH